jgi:hypothetical protein
LKIPVFSVFSAFCRSEMRRAAICKIAGICCFVSDFPQAASTPLDKVKAMENLLLYFHINKNAV